ncbi:hypothetical protein RQP53_19745 [Paucibacter sp. APW11]|uniref:FecR protein domain-containing protein n=1 Tax=Roseateles aquae TaxID=3077235 RepID=A0ABU3PFZ8_9BURK|nr:DUF6600 domain-containing protein [Paucibacter sp. APW11]MDT9001519.1 hypothetical protein [Paucibacter sp. APW11]
MDDGNRSTRLSRNPAHRSTGLRLAMALLLSVFLSSAWADPPARAGRVAELSGEAWVFDAENKAWQPLALNQTIAEGDRLRSEPGARLALRIGSISLWLDGRGDLEFSRLDDEGVELLLERGALGLRLRKAELARELSVRTREGRFAFEQAGLYRIDQLDRGTRAVNWDGRLRFDSRTEQAAPVWLAEREQVEFWWANGPRTERQSLTPDAFGDWLLAQNPADTEVQAYRYVSPEMTGAEELDRYGRWETVADYGTVWVPQQVAVDWAPYRHGRWVWTRHWGWSWVDESPWGFAPFHYGRWVHHVGRWCWVPGRYVARPVYSPALVAWVGGPVVSVGVSIGRRPPPPRYGWYPLAPREVYVPTYRHSPAYGQRINHDSPALTVQRPGQLPVLPPHRNRDVVGAISVLPVQGSGRPVAFTDRDTVLKPITQAPQRSELPLQTVPTRAQPPADAPQRAWNRGAEDRPRQPGQPAFNASGDSQAPAGLPTRTSRDGRDGRDGERAPLPPALPGHGAPLGTPPGGTGVVLPSLPTVPAPQHVPTPTVAAPVPPAWPATPPQESSPQRRLPERGSPTLVTPQPSPMSLPAPQSQPQPAPVAPVQQLPERRWERPAERSFERVPERAMERQLERPVERPVERHIERPVERPIERTVERAPERAVPERSQQRAPELPLRQSAPPQRSEEPRAAPGRGKDRDDNRRQTDR